MTTIKVKSCRNCPFCEYSMIMGSRKVSYANCMAPYPIHIGLYKVDSYFKNYTSPKWCGLNKHSIKIEKV